MATHQFQMQLDLKLWPGFINLPLNILGYQGTISIIKEIIKKNKKLPLLKCYQTIHIDSIEIAEIPLHRIPLQDPQQVHHQAYFHRLNLILQNLSRDSVSGVEGVQQEREQQ